LILSSGWMITCSFSCGIFFFTKTLVIFVNFCEQICTKTKMNFCDNAKTKLFVSTLIASHRYHLQQNDNGPKNGQNMHKADTDRKQRCQLSSEKPSEKYSIIFLLTEQ
jgi:hypothetical protein